MAQYRHEHVAAAEYRPLPGTAATERVSGRVHRFVTTITAGMLVFLLAACGIRLETTPPSEPIPDENEITRQAIVNDLALIQQHAALSAADVSDEALSELLSSIEQTAVARQDALGGTYVSGLPDAGDPTASAQDTDASLPIVTEADPASTAARLIESAARVRSSLDIAEDPHLARAVAALGVSHALEAQQLMKLAEVEIADPEALLPGEWTTSEPVLSDEQFVALVAAEDYAGYVYEVSAAMREPKSRTRLLSYAKLHRDQAQLLAEMAGVSQTANDPRRIAYALPFQLSAKEPVATNKEIATITRSVEKDLAADYLTLVASVAPADRALLYDAALASARRAQTLGASFDELFPLITGGDAIHALQSGSE